MNPQTFHETIKFVTQFIMLSLFALAILLVSCTSNSKSYLNNHLNSDERVELLLNEMTLDEKIGQMCQYVGEPTDNALGNKDEEVKYALALGERADLIKQGKIGSFLKVPTYIESNKLQELAEQSRLKIPLLIATDALHGDGMYKGATTLYPTQIGIASTFDTTLAHNIAKFTAHEMRACGFHWSFSPNIEVVRDARWGRTGETFGEDPYLVSMMGKAMINGYQGNNFGKADNVLACAKHFVAGGIAYNGLNGAPADISERTLFEVFFPPFIEAINANVYSIMPAHNEINGIPCHAHKEYLTDLIRNTWGFKGFYVSDWMDIERLYNTHKIVATEKEAAILAVLAGMDVHMQGPNFFEFVKAGVEEGLIPIERVDDAVRKILFAKFQLGLFENRYVDSAKVYNTLRKKEHLELALKTAQKSMVLLQNTNNILPLNKETASVFITGPAANSQAILGDWSRIQPNDSITTIFEGIKSVVSENTKVNYLECPRFDTLSDALIAQAIKGASAADVAIVVLGENSNRFDKDKTSGENLDRPILDLAGNQLELLQAIESTGKPVIVVLVNGGPIASPWMVENVDGILEAWEPGILGGQAVAEVLFGDYNPGGKLPITIPRTVGHVQSFYNHKPSAFHRGKFYQSETSPLFEFGFGLSYTQFAYSKLEMPPKIGIGDDLHLSVTIQNIGDMAGDEVMLVYLNDEISSVTTAVKKLVAFYRIQLKAGEKQEVKFILPNSCFKLYNTTMNQIVEPGIFNIIIGNNILESKLLIE